MLLFSAASLLYTPAYAQDALSQAQREHEQRLQEQQQRDRERQRRDQTTPDVFLQPPKQSSQDLPTTEDAPCINIKSISVSGVTVFGNDGDNETINAITRTYTSRCLLLSDINRLIADISNLYLDRGYITSRAFVQPQKIEKGTLEVLVIEGEIEALQSSEPRMKQSELNAAFPNWPVRSKQQAVDDGTDKHILYLRDLEQGIEQLNRVQQNSARLDLQPGSEVGKSIVNVVNDRGRPLHATVAADNSGSEQTGLYLVNTTFFWDNPIHRSDSLSLNVSRSLQAENDGSSQSYALNYSIPQNYFLFSVGANRFEYQQTVAGTTVDFTTTGESDNQHLRLDHVAYRGQHSKWSWNVGAIRKDTKNFIEDVFLETSSRTLYLANAGVQSTYQLQSGMFRSGLTYTRSLAIANATEKLVEAEVDYQFDKLDLDLGFYGRFESFGQRFSYSTALHYFYTPTAIVASEALALGGRYTVRGFHRESITGYNGGYLRNDLSSPFVLWQKLRIEPFIAFDIGQSDAPDYESVSQKSTATLSGASIGTRFFIGSLFASASYSKALIVPEFLTQNQSEFSFDLQMSF